jgi:hypothetical protein
MVKVVTIGAVRNKRAHGFIHPQREDNLVAQATNHYISAFVEAWQQPLVRRPANENYRRADVAETRYELPEPGIKILRKSIGGVGGIGNVIQRPQNYERRALLGTMRQLRNIGHTIDERVCCSMRQDHFAHSAVASAKRKVDPSAVIPRSIRRRPEFKY